MGDNDPKQPLTKPVSLPPLAPYTGGVGKTSETGSEVMKRKSTRGWVVLMTLLVLAVAGEARAAETPAYVRQEDVIYGRKDGMALTLDVITPKEGVNGAAVIWVVSGGFWLTLPLDMSTIADWFDKYLKKPEK